MRISSVLFAFILAFSRVECDDGDLDALIDEVFGPLRNTAGKVNVNDEDANKPKRTPDDNLNAGIEDVFGPIRNTGINNGEGRSDESSNCVCVPYYNCMNHTIITDGVGLIDVRVKPDACSSYLEVCCEEPLANEQRITPTPSVRVGCGRRNPNGVGFRITGHTDGESQPGEFPWVVAVLTEVGTPEGTLNTYTCGGALIHPQVVLTAGHCVVNRYKAYKIRAGEYDTQTVVETFPHQDARVKNVIIHPKYNSGSLHNDVALLFLESPITLTDNIDTVCLPKQGDIFDYSRCFATGWGKDAFGKKGAYQSILRKVEVPMVPRRECEQALRTTRLGLYFNLHETFVCAGGEQGKDTCKGDGGSPLSCPVANEKNKFVQVGIVSWGIDCGIEGLPGVYANVAAFRDWIDETMLYNGFGTEYYEY